MQHISGIPRMQMRFSTLEDTISLDNEVRFIDAFTASIDIVKLGFEIKTIKAEGRPSYATTMFLRIYLYGYLNKIRSSRAMQRECTRNTELKWLIHDIVPNYHSIADFRKDNPKALRKLFRLFVSFLKDAELIAGETIAIDGTKVRASNSKKANYSQKKIDRHIDYIDHKVEAYLQEMTAADLKDNQEKVTNVLGKIAKLKARKIDYELLEKKLIESGDSQISTTDVDARALLVAGQVVEVSHNLQAAVDAKYNLVVATHTINRNDRNALTDIALEAKENMGVETFTALVDKGYHNGRQIQQTTNANIITLVAHPEVVNTNEKGTTPAYMVAQFVYNKEADTYTCPQNETLKTTGTWHEKKTTDKVHYRFKKYTTAACKHCPVRNLCTAKADGRRAIDRSEFAEAVEENNKRYQENYALYRKRQDLKQSGKHEDKRKRIIKTEYINEHIFGTIKRQWGYNHTNLRGLEKVNGEHSLIMLVYNIKRTMNILGVPDLLAKLKNWNSPYKKEGFVLFFRLCFEPQCDDLFFEQKLIA
jgi:transposase